MLIINHTSNSKYYLSIGSLLKLEHSLVEATYRFQRVEVNAKDFIARAMSYQSDVNYLSSAHAYISLIPIVFVTQAQSNTSFYTNLRTSIFNYNKISIPNDTFHVPKILAPGLSEMVESESFVFGDEPLDLWGLYTLQVDGPIIFIWADKIYEYSKKMFPKQIKKYYELHVCQTILHEVMHALMDDIGYFNCRFIKDKYGNDLKALNDLKEESLAEAGSIALMKKYWPTKDIKYLLDFISNKDLFQYSLGSKLYRTGVSVVEFSVDNWVGFKVGDNPFHWTEFKKWIKYVAKNQKLVREKLIYFERKIFY